VREDVLKRELAVYGKSAAEREEAISGLLKRREADEVKSLSKRMRRVTR